MTIRKQKSTLNLEREEDERELAYLTTFQKLEATEIVYFSNCTNLSSLQ
jgi:hypothetical protein